MPTFKFSFRFPQCARAIAFAFGLLLTLTDTAQAAPSPQPSSDDWSSMIFSPYVITVGFVITLVALIVYKRRGGRPKVQGSPKSQVRVRAQAVEKSSSPVATPALESPRLPERPAQEAEAAQPWEKPAETPSSVFGA